MAEKRKLFEEVGDAQAARPVANTGVIDRGRGGARGAIRVWLFMLFTLVFVMIAVGGLTRLTDSGLSITEWKPFTGAMPPLNEADWQSEFAKYQEIDEFKVQNSWMQLSDFKLIYWSRDRAGLGDRVLVVLAAPSDSDGMDRALVVAGRAWWPARRNRLVDGVIGRHHRRGDFGRGQL